MYVKLVNIVTNTRLENNVFLSPLKNQSKISNQNTNGENNQTSTF